MLTSEKIKEIFQSHFPNRSEVYVYYDCYQSEKLVEVIIHNESFFPERMSLIKLNKLASELGTEEIKFIMNSLHYMQFKFNVKEDLEP